jgi:hypothetical protein
MTTRSIGDWLFRYLTPPGWALILMEHMFYNNEEAEVRYIQENADLFTAEERRKLLKNK